MQGMAIIELLKIFLMKLERLQSYTIKFKSRIILEPIYIRKLIYEYGIRFGPSMSFLSISKYWVARKIRADFLLEQLYSMDSSKRLF